MGLMLERIGWIVLGVAVHGPPFAALFFPKLISRLYSVEPYDPNFPLLHHRAALFGVIVVVCGWAAFDSDVRQLAFVVTALSMLSFLLIYLANDQPPSLRTIALVDLLGLPFLAFVGWQAFSA